MVELNVTRLDLFGADIGEASAPDMTGKTKISFRCFFAQDCPGY